jgi:hypothetical protein
MLRAAGRADGLMGAHPAQADQVEESQQPSLF